LNTSTIRGQKLGIVEEVQLVAKAGYQAIEPWMAELDAYLKSGGSLPELRKRIHDSGLTVESAIGFAPWIVNDESQRREGLEQAKREMGMIAELGGTRMAAPAAGAKTEKIELAAIPARYRALLEVGQQEGVAPELEVWGHSQTLGQLGEALYVAAEAQHPQTCLLLDVYHLYRGGSGFEGLKLLSGQSRHVMHVNDYPAQPKPPEITDAHRVYPGDGVAPLGQIFRDLAANGFDGFLSLELFNRDYWQQDAFTVLKTGLEKTRLAVEQAMAG
jgi:sugar phosphate isomerase/epimerase